MALAAHHLGDDPYELWHLGQHQRGTLTPHPRPMVYRAFKFACADWLERQQTERMKGVILELLATVLGPKDRRGAKVRAANTRRR